MHVKNGITVALQVLPIFPLIDTHGKDIENAIQGLVKDKKNDLTPDLQQGCAGYAKQLQKRQRDGRPFISVGFPKMEIPYLIV